MKPVLVALCLAAAGCGAPPPTSAPPISGVQLALGADLPGDIDHVRVVARRGGAVEASAEESGPPWPEELFVELAPGGAVELELVGSRGGVASWYGLATVAEVPAEGAADAEVLIDPAGELVVDLGGAEAERVTATATQPREGPPALFELTAEEGGRARWSAVVVAAEYELSWEPEGLRLYGARVVQAAAGERTEHLLADLAEADCPDVRPDLPVAVRAPVEWEVALDVSPRGERLTAIGLAPEVGPLLLGTTAGLLRLEPGGEAEPFSALAGTVTTLARTADRTFVGTCEGPDPCTGWLVTLDAAGAEVARHESVSPLVVVRGPDGDVVYGDRTGHLFHSGDAGRTWEPADAAVGGGHVASITFVGPDGAVAGLGRPGGWLESFDGGASFAERQEPAHGFAVAGLAAWGAADGPGALLVMADSSERGADVALVRCAFPCLDPVPLPGGEAIRGRAIEAADGGSGGMPVRVDGDAVVTATADELWLSTDGGRTVRLVTNLLGCEPVALQDVAVGGEGVWVAAGGRLVRFPR